jgi:hypothetical protein
MRGFREIKGQCTRLVYDRERATFLVKFEPHAFVMHEPATEVQAKQNGATEVQGKQNGDGTEPTRRRKW